MTTVEKLAFKIALTALYKSSECIAMMRATKSIEPANRESLFMQYDEYKRQAFELLEAIKNDNQL